jgi:hypothetical protein
MIPVQINGGGSSATSSSNRRRAIRSAGVAQ